MGYMCLPQTNDDRPQSSHGKFLLLMEAVQSDADYVRIAHSSANLPPGLPTKIKHSRRPNFKLDFKIRLVREALQMPPHSRIKPTCARYPGVEPCQLRKWIRLYAKNSLRGQQATSSGLLTKLANEFTGASTQPPLPLQSQVSNYGNELAEEEKRAEL